MRVTRRGRLAAVLNLAVGMVLLGPSGPAQAATNADLRSALNNRCLEYTAGSGPTIRDCTGIPNQKWNFDDGHVLNLGASRCLTETAQYDGAPVTTAPCDGSAAQGWQIDGRQLRNRADGRCLEIAGRAYDVGASVSVHTCDAASARRWWLDFRQSHYRSDLNELCLSIRDDRFAVTAPCDGATATKFWPGEANEMFLVRRSLCLDVLGGNPQNGAEVVGWECNGTPSQRWSQDGRLLRNGDTGKCLEIINAATAPGGRIGMSDCAGQTHQNWRIR